LVGALGMLAGGLLAAMLPRTPAEDEWFGPSRDRLWNRAEKAGEETGSRVRDVAMRAADAAADAAAETVHKEADKPLSACRHPAARPAGGRPSEGRAAGFLYAQRDAC